LHEEGKKAILPADPLRPVPHPWLSHITTASYLAIARKKSDGFRNGYVLRERDSRQ
jgi:hypothetical protein